MAADILAAWALITQGQIFAAVIGVFVDLLGAPWFYLIIFGLGVVMTYLRSDDATATLVVGFIISPVLIPIFPSVIHYVIFIFVAAIITGLLYRVFHK